MQRRKGPKRIKRYVNHKPAPRKKRSKRSKRRRVCPLHGRTLVWESTTHGQRWTCPEGGCDIRQGPAVTSTACDSATSRERWATHALFDSLWKECKGRRFSSRQRTYEWLADTLGISMRECHVGRFDIETCLRAQAAIAKLLKK